MLKELAYLFLYNSKSKEYSTLSKAAFSLSMLALLYFSWRMGGYLSYIYPVLIACVELGMVSYLKGASKALKGLAFIAFFILIGTAIFMLNRALGLPSPRYEEVVTGSVRLFAFFLAFSLFFQLISLEEWRGIMLKLGLRDQALMFSVIGVLLPLTLMQFSEALTTVKLKYGGKRLTSLVVPMAFLAVMNSRNIVEAMIVYPPRVEGYISLFKPRDLILYVILAALLAPLLATSILT